MGHGDFILYKNSERHFEVRHLLVTTDYDVTNLIQQYQLDSSVPYIYLSLRHVDPVIFGFFFGILLNSLRESNA